MTLAFLQSPIRFAFGLLACLFLATLVGLANAETPTRLDAIVGAGVLRVGLTEDYRPFSFADASGKLEGVDVDMAVSLVQSRGVRLEIVKTSWPTLKSDLEAEQLRHRDGVRSSSLPADVLGATAAKRHSLSRGSVRRKEQHSAHSAL